MKAYKYDLIIVVPVYNEEKSINHVINEWDKTFKDLNIKYKFLLLNDGSKDNTKTIIEELSNENKNIQVMNKNNTGHGQTCIYGYKEAIKMDTEWIFQIDSDGQCDPKYFGSLWEIIDKYNAVFGRRIKRDDGFLRVIISYFNRIVVLLSTGINVLDSNVPYRLMKSKILNKFIETFPADVYLANILLSAILKKALLKSMMFINIGFKKRYGGEPSVKWGNFAARGWDLFISLIKKRDYIKKAIDLININRG